MLIWCVLWTPAATLAPTVPPTAPTLSPSVSPTAPSVSPSVSPSVPPTWSPCTGIKIPVVGGAISNPVNDPTCAASACWNGVSDSSWNNCPAEGCCELSGGSLDMCRSQGATNVWLRVDFSADVVVECVSVFNRRTQVPWSGRLSYHEIRVGDDSSIPTNNNVCSSSDQDTTAVLVVHHAFNSPCTGRHVYVYLPETLAMPTRYLNLVEVEVFGYYVPTVSPTAPTASPTTSPTTSVPTKSPTTSPATSAPSDAPTTSVPSRSPTQAPTTSSPTDAPTTSVPTKSPTTSSPTDAPTTSVPTKS
eukprot:Hpha_TRINITY_DN15217_c0_g4::TRINITY_DN15217_c0_g4_i1::g.66344::m.66344